MGRGLDGYFFFDTRSGCLCGFEGLPDLGGAGSEPVRSLAILRWLLREGNTSSHSEQSS